MQKAKGGNAPYSTYSHILASAIKVIDIKTEFQTQEVGFWDPQRSCTASAETPPEELFAHFFLSKPEVYFQHLQGHFQGSQRMKASVSLRKPSRCDCRTPLVSGRSGSSWVPNPWAAHSTSADMESRLVLSLQSHCTSFFPFLINVFHFTHRITLLCILTNYLLSCTVAHTASCTQ